MMVFVVTMYRYGNPEAHSYVLGVWSTLDGAQKAGAAEEAWRGSKYRYRVTSWHIDADEWDRVPSADQQL